MKIKIIFSVLSAMLFGGGLLVVSMDGARSGSVLGEVSSVMPSTTISGSVGQAVKTDSLPPVRPGQPVATMSADLSLVKLQWTPSVDAWRDIAYKVFRNGKPIATTRFANHVDVDIVPGTTYSYAVQASDASGNTSEKSPATSVTVPRAVENVPVFSNAAASERVGASAEMVSGVSPLLIETPKVGAGSVSTVSSPKNADRIGGEGSPVGVQQQSSPTVAATEASGKASADRTDIFRRKQSERVSPIVPGETLSLRDTDGDGLSDAEEIRLGTDPLAGDTDSDGFGDGEEVKKGFNPLKSAASDRGDKVVFESPKEKRISKTASEDRRLRVEKVDRTRKEDGTVVTKFSGKGVPNSVLTLYVYSDPIVVTVKTDSDGNWSYELDRDIEDGRHEVYVAVTNATGRISSQSSPIPFVKTAEAVSVGAASDLDREVRGNQSPIERAGTGFIFVGIVLTIVFLLAAFYFIGRRALVN